MIRIVGQKIIGTPFRVMTPRATKTSLLLLARKGPVRARDLDRAGIPRTYLKRLSDRGLLEQVDRGLYRIADAPVTELSSLAEVSKRVPHATIRLLSALQVHGMTSEAPHAVWILIERNARVPKVSSPAIEVVRASGTAREHGALAGHTQIPGRWRAGRGISGVWAAATRTESIGGD